jgi:hypothetical protein
LYFYSLGAFLSQARPPRTSTSAVGVYAAYYSSSSSRHVGRDIRELEAALKADAAAAAANAANAAAAANALAAKGAWLFEVVKAAAAVSNTNTNTNTASTTSGAGGGAVHPPPLTLHLPMAVVGALAKTYFELAAVVGSIPVSVWTR